MGKAQRGIYAAAVSPIGADGALDGPALAAYARWLLDNGCDGVAPAGTTGEGTSLALADRLALPGIFAKAGLPSDRVIFGAGAAALGDAVRLARACLDAGYPNVLVLPPFYYKGPSDDGVYDFFGRLIEGVGDASLRVYLYHFPQMSAVPFSPELVARLKADFGPVVAGLKDSSGDFAQSAAFLAATGGVDADFDVYPSSEAMLWDGLDKGAAGVISGSTNAFGAVSQAALQATEEDREAAMAPVRAARQLAAGLPLIPAMKQVQAWRTADEAWLRMLPPHRPLTEAQQTELRAGLEALDLFPR